MTDAAQYLIAQHVPDVFRREPRNVGIFVSRGDALVARFLGEVQPNQMDQRKLRSFSHPSVYMQWVEYWRNALAGGNAWKDLLDSSGSHYRVVEGGELADIGNDPIEDVLNYLYALLVSEGRLAEALATQEEVKEGAFAGLLDDVTRAFKEAQILAPPEPQLLTVPHPVRRGVAIRGTTREPHHPAFVQDNGQLCVMETIDLTTRFKVRAKDHAGWAAYMFDDIQKSRTDKHGARAISIIRCRGEDESDENVRYALSLLEMQSTQLLNWLSASDRGRFVRERTEAAQAEA